MSSKSRVNVDLRMLMAIFLVETMTTSYADALPLVEHPDLLDYIAEQIGDVHNGGIHLGPDLSRTISPTDIEVLIGLDLVDGNFSIEGGHDCCWLE